MMNGIKKKKYNAIISWAPDRLARNMKEGGEIIDLLDNQQILKLVFTSYMFNNDSNGKMALGIQFVLAKQYTDANTQASIRGGKGRVSAGQSPNGRSAYGYTLISEGYYFPDGKNFELIQKAFKMALAGKPFPVIIQMLEENDFQYNNVPKKLSKQDISDMLKEPLYAGFPRFYDEHFDITDVNDYFKPALSIKNFLELRARIEKKPGFKGKQQLFLQRMIYCGHCGNLMTVYVSSRSKKEQNKLRYMYCKCNNTSCERHNKELNIKNSIRIKVITKVLQKLA